MDKERKKIDRSCKVEELKKKAGEVILLLVVAAIVVGLLFFGLNAMEGR
jgi:hypothetical protein